MKRGNPYHHPAGSSNGGQFASGSGIASRPTPIEHDVAWYAANQCDTEEERQRNVAKGLYDGGYLVRPTDPPPFATPREGEAFLREISQNAECTEVWKDHRELVENYVEVVKGELLHSEYDVVTNGHYSKDGSERNAEELTKEFNLSKSEVRDMVVHSISADNFVSSGKNVSKYQENHGTVVMVFTPRVTITKKKMVNLQGRGMQEKTTKHTIDLYVKLAINPHPDEAKGHHQMQILSFKEADNKECLFTGEARMSRDQWKHNKGHKDNPKRRK